MAPPISPNEIYLEILSHCDYLTLKICQRVCKNFALLIRHPSMDYQLFRAGAVPSPDMNDGSKPVYTIHPAMRWVGVSNNQSKQLVGESLSTYLLPDDIAREFATYPPVQKIGLEHNFSFVVSSSRDEGVSVRDVFYTFDWELSSIGNWYGLGCTDLHLRPYLEVDKERSDDRYSGDPHYALHLFYRITRLRRR